MHKLFEALLALETGELLDIDLSRFENSADRLAARFAFRLGFGGDECRREFAARGRRQSELDTCRHLH